MPHETHAQQHRPTPESDKPAATAKPDSHVQKEGTPPVSPVVRFRLNGITKSINRPVTNADLYRLAGGPQTLAAGGKTIPNDAEPLELPDDADVTAAY